MREVLIFRTHRDNDFDQQLLLEYKKEVAGFCDLAVCLNLKSRSVKTNWAAFCREHNIPLCINYENENKPSFYKGAWIHGQYGLIEAYNALRGRASGAYDYYWIIEYDIRFTGSLKMLMSDHHEMTADVLGTYTSGYAGDGEYTVWREPNVNFPLPIEDCVRNFAPLMRLSSRLFSVLPSQALKYYSNIETFIPSVSVKLFGRDSVQTFKTRYWNRDSCRYAPQWGPQEKFAETVVSNPQYKNIIFHPVK